MAYGEFGEDRDLADSADDRRRVGNALTAAVVLNDGMVGDSARSISMAMSSFGLAACLPPELNSPASAGAVCGRLGGVTGAGEAQLQARAQLSSPHRPP